MSTQPESKLSRKVLGALRQRGAFCFKVWGSEHMMAGLPDIIGCYRGKFFAFEVKMPEKRANVSKIQHRVHHKIDLAGGHVRVVCSVAEALDELP